MRARPSFRLSVEAKVLVPVLTFLILLPLVTVVLVDTNIREQAHKEARQNLSMADKVFRNSLDLRARSLAGRFVNGSNEPRYRALAGLDDAATFTAFLRDELEQNPDGADVMVLESANGVTAGAKRPGASIRVEEFTRLAAPVSSLAHHGETASDLITIGSQIFNVIAIPIFRDNGGALLGALTVGVPIGEREAMELESLTQTRIVLLGRNGVAVATLGRLTLDPARDAGDATVGQVRDVQLDEEHFLALAQDYASATSTGPAFRYVLLSSYEARWRALVRTRLTLLGVSALGIAISGIVVWMLVHRIIRPLRDLRDGAEAIGRGDFTRRIERYSNDECGDLATSFNRMTDGLQTSRAELERTVSTLRQTQEQLVQRELRLRESEEGLRLIIESARDHAIVTLDGQGRILRWNPAAERMLGYSTEEAHGLAYGRLFDGADRESGVPGQALATATREGRHGFECRRVRKDGSIFWADVTLSPLPGGSAGSAGFVEIARDITVRKQAEQSLRDARDAAEAASRSKTEFLANMTHELRTPMNAIIGMSSLLIDRQDPGETRECAGTIQTSAHALLDIIDDILDLSKIEAGNLELAREAFDVVGSIEHVIDHYAARAARKRIELGAVVARDTPSIILGDAARLRQVLGCLVSNAVKFTDRGGVSVTVAGAQPDDAPGTIRFSVEDTGIGIPSSHLGRLFQPFSQGDGSTTRKHGGTGLGLVISRRLVELMGGTIAVESTPGRGSRFTFTIAGTAQPAPAEFGGVDGCRVGLSTRSAVLADLLQRQLEAWGAVVVDPGDHGPVAARITDTQDLDLPDGTGSATAGLVVTVNSFNIPDAAGGLARAIKPRALHAALRRRDRIPAAAAPIGTAFAAAHPLRVLLVEDNPINALVALKMLGRFGYSAGHCENGRLALEQLQREACDLVLMDLQMPELDGLDTTRAIRALVPASHPPYIVALTANSRKEDREACFAAGMHGFMAKPIEAQALRDTLDQAHAWITRAGRSTLPLPAPGAPAR